MTEENYHKCGELLRSFREKSGLSQQELAAELQAKHQTISFWENNTRKISLDSLLKIIHILHLHEGIQTREEAESLLWAADYRSLRNEEYVEIFQPFTGRENQLRRLDTYLDETLKEKGQVVFVTGEAGQGKTTLVTEFMRWVHKRFPAVVIVRGDCELTQQHDPYLPFRQISAQLSDGTDQLWPPVTRDYLFKQYLELIQSSAKKYPLLLLLEDLHWADSSSISLLSYLGQRIRSSRVLIIGTYRVEEIEARQDGKLHPLKEVVLNFKHYFRDNEIRLHLIEEVEGLRFIDALIDRFPNRLSGNFRHKLFRHTGSNALFATELLQVLQKRGDLIQDTDGYWIEGKELDWQEMPEELEGVIERRVSYLPSELQELLKVASVEGDVFAVEIVARSLPADERQTMKQFSEELSNQYYIVSGRGIRHRGTSRFSIYQFKHSLFQKYVYTKCLDPIERAFWHQRIGESLESIYNKTVDSEDLVVQLVRHFRQAKDTPNAIKYLYKLGMRALYLSANQDAIHHLKEGISLLDTQPDTEHRSHQKAEFLLALGQALMVSYGYAHWEVEKCFSDAAELCKNSSQINQYDVQQGLWVHYLLQGKLRHALNLAQQLRTIAKEMDNEFSLLISYCALGISYFHLGLQVEAKGYLSQAINLFHNITEEKSSDYRYTYFVVDTEVNILSYDQHVSWLLGDTDQAFRQSAKALTLAQQEEHPYSQNYALAFATVLHLFHREEETAKKLAINAIELANEYGFSQWKAHEIIMYGRALAEEERVEEGINKIQQGLEQWEATGAKLAKSYYLSLLAETYLKAGKLRDGLVIINQALDCAEEDGELWWLSEIYRLKGDLLLSQGKSDAEIWFEQALEVARKQRVKSLELRSAISLSRLQQQKGQPEEAKQVLEDICEEFQEANSKDAKEARGLLKALHSG